MVIEQSLYIPSGLSFNTISETGLYISSRPIFFSLNLRTSVQNTLFCPVVMCLIYRWRRKGDTKLSIFHLLSSKYSVALHLKLLCGMEFWHKTRISAFGDNHTISTNAHFPRLCSSSGKNIRSDMRWFFPPWSQVTLLKNRRVAIQGNVVALKCN